MKPITWRYLKDILEHNADIDLDLPVMIEIEDGGCAGASENIIFNTYKIHKDMDQGDELDNGQLILSWN
jgi:hypothetical protein